MWEHAPSMDMPLSEDALQFARKLAASKYTYPDDRLAVADLLERWNLGLGSSVAERRMALRLSREASLLDAAEPTDEVTHCRRWHGSWRWPLRPTSTTPHRRGGRACGR